MNQIDNTELHLNLLQAEDMIRHMVLRGCNANEQLVEAIDNRFNPKTEWEQEMFSEAIIYAKQGVLN